MRIQCLLATALACLSSATMGCDSQAGPDYPGDRLAVITGSVTNDLTIAPDGVDAVLVWFAEIDGDDTFISQRVPVSSDFPSTFRMEVFTPPPEGAFARVKPSEPRIALALFVAAKPQSDVEDPNNVLGLAEHHALIYLENDALPDSDTAKFLHGVHDAGFHIMDIVEAGEPGCPEDGFDCLFSAADALSTIVPLRLDELDNLTGATRTWAFHLDSRHARPRSTTNTCAQNSVSYTSAHA